MIDLRKLNYVNTPYKKYSHMFSNMLFVVQAREISLKYFYQQHKELCDKAELSEEERLRNARFEAEKEFFNNIMALGRS